MMKLIVFSISVIYLLGAVHSSSEEDEIMYRVQALNHPVVSLGEGPHWDVDSQSLYFVDINGPTIFRYDHSSEKIYQAKINNETFVSFIIPIDGKPNNFAIGVARRVVQIEWDGISDSCKVISTLFEVEKNEKFNGNRFNDAKADPKGRFFGGTMPAHLEDDLQKTKRNGNLYRMDKTLTTPKLLKDNVIVSNGLAWNVASKKFYYIDTADMEVKQYDYDIETGEIKNLKVLSDFRSKNYKPDGMTIDDQGFLYVATYGDSKILKINPTDGKIEMEIKLPCEQITSAAFGGPNFDILFVTTASQGDKVHPAGLTFKVIGLGVKGLPMKKLNL